MRASRGFTVIEALIGLAILIVAILGAMSFFIFGSQKAQESFRYKSVEEVLASVAGLITYDIQRAGFGLFPHTGTTYPMLGLFVIDGGLGGGPPPEPLPDELYLNYSQYLSLESNPQAPPIENSPPTCASQYRAINSVFTRPDKAFTCISTLYYQGFVLLPSAVSLNLYAVPASLSRSDIGAVVATPSGGGGVVAAADATCADTAGPLTGTKNWTISFPASGKNATGGTQALQIGWAAVPAVRYQAVQGVGSTTGRLLRNGAVIMGGDAALDVRNFQVNCQFADSTWQTTNASPVTLRMVEINISYRLNRGKGGDLSWSPVYSRTLRVTPRTIVLKQTVG